MFKVQDGLSFYNMGSKWEFAVPSCTNVDIYSDFNHIKANLHPEKNTMSYEYDDHPSTSTEFDHQASMTCTQSPPLLVHLVECNNLIRDAAFETGLCKDDRSHSVHFFLSQPDISQEKPKVQGSLFSGPASRVRWVERCRGQWSSQSLRLFIQNPHFLLQVWLINCCHRQYVFQQ